MKPMHVKECATDNKAMVDICAGASDSVIKIADETCTEVFTTIYFIKCDISLELTDELERRLL